MKITKEEIKALNPCNAGYEWYLKNQNDDLMTLLLKLNDRKPDWARWLFSRIMSRRQRIMIAVFSAKSVLEKFERAYPDDDRPRRAIEAAESCIDNATAKAAAKAAYASDAAEAAACAAVQDYVLNSAPALTETDVPMFDMNSPTSIHQ